MIFQINDIDIPKPSKLSVSESDLDSDYSGRTASGRMNRYVIRKNVIKLEMQWIVTAEEYEFICECIKDDFFRVKFPFRSEIYEREMYAGDRKGEVRTFRGKEYWNLSCSFIER